MLGEVPLHGVVVRPGRTALAAVVGGRYGAPGCPYSALVMFRAVAGSTCSASAPCARRRSAACRRLLEIWAVREARPIVEAGVAGRACIHLPEVSPFRARRSEPTVGFYAKKILCFMEKRDAVAMVFYLAGGVVRGLARLQYVVFLLQKEVGLGGFWFEPRRFGPWSMELEGALAALEREGLLSVRLEEPGPADAFGERPLRVYAASQALVERGGEEFEKLVKRDQFKAYLARRLVAIGIAIPLPRLLTYIYLKYPEAVPHAEREKVYLWRRLYGIVAQR